MGPGSRRLMRQLREQGLPRLHDFDGTCPAASSTPTDTSVPSKPRAVPPCRTAKQERMRC
eukprot:16432397-Heterocapsa_arctica.AAC.1